MRHRLCRAVCSGLLSAATATAALTVLQSPARAAATFTGSAAAYGIDSTVSNPSVPLGLVVQAAGPAAQATLSSLQQSDTFASFPYPGEGVAGLPGVVGGTAGVPLPAYPFIVATSLGEPRSGVRSERRPSPARAPTMMRAPPRRPVQPAPVTRRRHASPTPATTECWPSPTPD
ncbi:MAG: hypothetical protein ABR549_07020 [Mycobacteriales bacterium]